MERLHLFVGSDPRESVGLHVFLESLWKHTSIPVDLTVLTPKLGEQLGIKSDGTNSFSKLRFVCPYLSGFKGFSLFLDGADMLLRTDLAELWALRDTHLALQCVKHSYKTKFPRKYVGTTLEAENQDYPRKQWSSVILWNNGYSPHQKLTPEFISKTPGPDLHRFSWVPDDRIGELPKEWNHIPGEIQANPNAKLVHFSLGIPGFEHYRRNEHSPEWTEHLRSAAKGLQYLGK